MDWLLEEGHLTVLQQIYFNLVYNPLFRETVPFVSLNK